MCGGRDEWEISVPSTQFCCEPGSALKNKALKKNYCVRRTQHNPFHLRTLNCQGPTLYNPLHNLKANLKYLLPALSQFSIYST